MKKIILTTDQDLIKDGVQAIDDEFLEWFVKNPSCEYVEVNKVSVNCSCANQSGYRDNANVILENSTCHLRNNCKTKHKIIIPKEEPKQKWDINTCRYWDVEIGCEREKCICENQEPKQETLEEVALKYFPKTNSHFDRLDEVDGNAYYRSIFKQGAKWQQERMYSEEDLKQFAFECVANFLSNRENKVEIELVNVISDRNNELFE